MNHSQIYRFWRSVAQFLLGGIAVALVTFVCLRLRLNLATTVCLYLIVIVLLSLQGRFLSSAVVSIIAVGCLAYYFAPPIFSFRVSDPFEVVAIIVFLTTSALITHFVSRVRKSAEETQALEDQLRLVIDTIPTLAWSAVPDGSRDFLNQRWLEYTGLSLEEGLGQGWQAAIHPEDRARLVDEWRAALAAGEPLETEERVRRADGEYRWFLLRAVPLRDKLGNIVKWYGTSTDIEDRKQAEKGLREQASLLNLTHDTVFVRDVNDVITYWNRGAAELYVWTGEEAVGKVSHQLLQTVFPAPLEEINAELLRTGRWEGELVHTKRDGTQVIVASRWSMQQDEQGRPLTTLETNNDITERKRAEEGRRYNTQLLRTMTDNASSMLFMVDAAGLTTFVNPAVERITGYRADELIGQVVHDKIHHSYPDGGPHPLNECPLSGAVRMRKPVRGEDLFVRKDSTFFPVRYSVSPVFRDSVPVGAVIEVQDVTESKAAEEEVRKQAELLSLAHDAIFVRDLESRVIFWNQGAENTYGWTAEEAMGRVTHELLQTRFPVSLEAVDVALQEQGEWEGELTHITRKGTAIVVTSRQSLRRDERGAAAAVLEINRDITERKRAEEALHKAQAELAHVTRVATLGEMTASISHEINQPLAAVVNNASACLRWLAASNLEEARQSAALVIADGHRAGEIIGRIRALAKKSPLRKDWLYINETILEVTALARSEVQRNRVSLETQLADDVPLILGDRIQLQQVILNLIINAIEAMSGVGEGPRELLVGSGKDELQGVRVTVRDSGPGLDPESIDHLFTAFFTTKPKGMGMGLAISRSIIQAHGGRLWATPNDGPGATFQFTLDVGFKEERPLIV
jgi:two-component system sensor kinase FixL